MSLTVHAKNGVKDLRTPSTTLMHNVDDKRLLQTPNIRPFRRILVAVHFCIGVATQTAS
jgi:hypothetical protein